MGVAYYRVQPDVLESVQLLVRQHEAEPVGPRARGYWFDYPDTFDFDGVRAVALQLDKIGKANALETLELSEVQAHSLSMLEIEVPSDGGDFAPSLFLTSLPPDGVRAYLKIVRKFLGSDPARAASRFATNVRDPRLMGYMRKQVRVLRETLPLVWGFHERAAEANHAVLVIDLRARDLFVPDEVELSGLVES